MPKKRKPQNCNFDRNDMQFFYGVPHCHTAFSTGKGNPYDAFEIGRSNGLDFMIITDHNSFLTREIPFENNEVSKWEISNILRERFYKRNDNFLPLIGFETKTEPYGDFNIINPNNFFTGIVKDLKLLVLWMLNNPDSVVILNHPHKNVLNLDYDPVLNRIITSVEVCNGALHGKYLRSEKYYYYLLDKGWRLGSANGQDNHKLNFGQDDNLTCIICNELNTQNLIEAFRCKRTYSTESRTLKMYFTINDSFMGSEIVVPNGGPMRFELFLDDINHKIKDIEIITNTGAIVQKINNINLNKIKYLFQHIKASHENWYLIKIFQDDNKISYSSPIFVDSK
ncbi:MAG: CehA/McbA family metallohydrolase [Clostridium sp.]